MFELEHAHISNNNDLQGFLCLVMEFLFNYCISGCSLQNYHIFNPQYSFLYSVRIFSSGILFIAIYWYGICDIVWERNPYYISTFMQTFLFYI